MNFEFKMSDQVAIYEIVSSFAYCLQFSMTLCLSLQAQNFERLYNQAVGTLRQQDCVIADTNVLKIAVLSSYDHAKPLCKIFNLLYILNRSPRRGNFIFEKTV